MDNETNVVEEPLRQKIRKLEHLLRERDRELGCLYNIANVADGSDSTLEEILQAIARLLPHAFQYPELACARIVMGAQEFRTDNFRHTPFKLASSITVRGNNAGEVEIFYAEESPGCDEGPFLAEERSFINVIAGRLGALIEKKTIEDAIRKSEEKYRSIFENAVEGIFQTTPDGFLLSANPAYAKMFGYPSVEELIGGPFNVGKTYAHAADRVRFKRQINEHGLIQTFQFQALRKDGTPIWACLNARAVKDGKGRILYYEGTIEDITSLKQAEKEARDNAERYRRLFELESDAIFVIDDETGRILEANNAAASIYGFSREEILEMRNEDLSAEPDNPRRAIYHKKKDGTVFPVEITTTRLMWNGRRSHLSTVRDISDRLNAEEALLKSEQDYRNIYDNAMVGIFQSLPEGRYLRVNPALARIHGFPSPEEMISAVTDIDKQMYVDPLDRRRYMTLLDADDMIRGFEAQLYRKDKTRVWIRMNVRVVRRDDGTIDYYEGIVEDVTKCKNAEDELKSSAEKLRRSLSGTIEVISMMLQTRDPYTGEHQKRVSRLARAIAQEMKLHRDTVENIRIAGTIHDIGKMSVPAEILAKPTRLSNIEMSLLRTHPQTGYDILKVVDLPSPIAEIVLQHHERLDGSGYPRGLKMGEILLEAQIMAIADVVEAMSSHRPYRPALGLDAALEEIESGNGTLYLPEVVDACLRLFKIKGFKW